MNLEQVYGKLREAEWQGKSLSAVITALELEFPSLRETDLELEAGPKHTP